MIYKMVRLSDKIYLITKTRMFKYILKISNPKKEIFQIKILIFFIFLLKNVDCGYSFLSRNEKTLKPQFYYIKVGFKGVKII